MTIELNVYAIPIVINVILLAAMFISMVNDSGWFAGITQVIFFVIGTLFIWLAFFAVMYFCK